MTKYHVCILNHLLIQAFFIARPKPAYGRQGLDWIVRPLGKVIIFRDKQTDRQTDVTHGGIQPTF